MKKITAKCQKWKESWKQLEGKRSAMANVIIMNTIIKIGEHKNLTHRCSLQILLNASINYG